MERPFLHVRSADGPVSWLGTNFWSRNGGPLMWRDYDPKVVREELAVLADHGLRQTRTFCYLPDMHPEPDRIDDEKLGHYADFLDAHAEVGMSTIPTYLVGHMSGENWDPSWRAGRDLYTDVRLVAAQAWFVEQVTRRLAGHPAVAGWLISNEMPIYGRRRGEPPAATDDVTAWARLMVQAVRAGGGTGPVSLGDGAWGIEVTGDDNGFSVRRIGEIVDFVGPHVYRMEDDQLRQHLNAAFVCELAAVARRPVVLEEFGVTTDFVSSEGAASYYRQTLHNSLLAGATGWICWNNTDYDHLAGQDPYRHHPFEIHFGITDSTGAPKPPLLEMQAFGQVLAEVDVTHLRRDDAQAALVVSSYLERGYPFTLPEDRSLVFRTLRQAYVATREAGLPVGFSREEDGLAEDCRLYLVPSTRQLTAPTWQQLERLAEGGATVWVSYCAGDSAHQRAGWWPSLDRLFGVEHGLRYGLNDPIEDDEVQLTFADGFGSLPAGEGLTFRVAGDANSRAFLPVTVRDAELVATDGHDRPAIVRRRIGSGSLVLCTYPLEHMASVTPHVNPEPTHRLYAALAEEAAVRPPVRSGDPLVFTDTLTHEDGRRFAWFVSQHPNGATVRPQLASGSLASPDGTGMEEVTLDPYGVRVLQLLE